MPTARAGPQFNLLNQNVVHDICAVAGRIVEWTIVQSICNAKVVTHWFITPDGRNAYATDTCYHRNRTCAQRGNVSRGICAKKRKLTRRGRPEPRRQVSGRCSGRSPCLSTSSFTRRRAILRRERQHGAGQHLARHLHPGQRRQCRARNALSGNVCAGNTGNGVRIDAGQVNNLVVGKHYSGQHRRPALGRQHRHGNGQQRHDLTGNRWLRLMAAALRGRQGLFHRVCASTLRLGRCLECEGSRPGLAIRSQPQLHLLPSAATTHFRCA
jgi:hypothetical protein